MIADDELHENVNELLRNASLLIFGRTTYQLMEDAWPAIVMKPTGNKPMDEFAVLIDNISKVVFSTTLDQVEWKNTTLLKGDIRREILKLKTTGEENGYMVAGSPSIIVQLMKLDLIDEYQFCVHPVILGEGLTLFKNFENRKDLSLIKTKTYRSGAVMFYFHPKQSHNNQE
jgi:dihydrofolate reductase